ncbi:MAG TPA: VCBS repeat-containing protein [Thermoanaerobaculia bacterium]|nr:VCBS repeat-containing protein [Thermoanaerobaculia bacterium]
MSLRDVIFLRKRGPRPSLPALFLAVLPLLLTFPASAAPRPASPGLKAWSLDLPGAPAAVVPSDVDGDGRTDLVVAVAYNQWDQIEITESTTMDDIEGLVEVMTIVPSLLDRREVRVYLARPDGSYAQSGPALPLPLSVLSLEAGPPGTPVLALTDEGVSALRLDASGAPRLEPLIADPPVFAGTGNFLAGLELVRDLSGDGVADLLLPGRNGLAVYLGGPGGISARAASRFRVPGEVFRSRGELEHRYPLPAVQDVNGDGLPDLVFRDPVKRWSLVRVARNAGNGKFSQAVEVDLEGDARPQTAKDVQPVHFGDLDGDGIGEVVSQESLDKEDVSIRQSMKQVREPKYRLSFRRVGKGLKRVNEAYRTVDVTGHAFSRDDSGGDGDMEVSVNLPGGFQDLNGDGLQDLVTITMDLSIPKIMGSMATKRLTLGLDFHVWCQDKAGDLRRVSGLDLSGKFRLNFNDLRVSQLSLFSGDFDGDGRSDFVQLGRGKTVTIHRGRPDCSFPKTPDLTVALKAEPLDMSLVQIRDLNGDKRSDLMVLQPRGAAEPGMAPPVRLDLYLSDGPHLLSSSPISQPPAPGRGGTPAEDLAESEADSTPTVPAVQRDSHSMPRPVPASLATTARTGPSSPGGGRSGDGRGGQEVRSQRAGGYDILASPLPGKLLRWAPARDRAGRPGFAMLVASGEDLKARSLWFVDPVKKTLQRLADLHGEVNAVAAFDLDGDGTATPVASMPGVLFAPGSGGGAQRVLEDSDVDLLSVDGLSSVWPAGLPWLPTAVAGHLQLLTPGPGGALGRGDGFDLPLKAERPRWGLRLTSPAVTLLGRGGDPVLAVGPEAHGRRRLRSLVLAPGGGEPVESWSLLPGEERLVDQRYLRINGRPALAVGTIEKIGIFVKKRLRLFFVERDRSRRGTAPVLAAETDCALWNPLTTFAADADGDGQDDLVLVHPEGMNGGELLIAVYRNLGNGKFESRPRKIKLPLTARDWDFGSDLSGDGVPDLLVLADGKLHLYPGERDGRPVASRAAWSVAVGKSRKDKEKEKDEDDTPGRRDDNEADFALATSRSLDVVDLDGDGIQEIAVRAEGEKNRSVLYVLRKAG